METVRSRKDWGAEVVYGDTDSLFIYLPGKSKEDAFRIGNEMAEVVTSQNPRPIKLKFEKVQPVHAAPSARTDTTLSQVYLPSVLIAKKRYVGFKYEYLKQKEPDFDAKGIETIRRDGIAGTQKMQETCLKCVPVRPIRSRSDSLLVVQDPLSHLRPFACQGLLPAPVEEAASRRRLASGLYYRKEGQARQLCVRGFDLSTRLPMLTRSTRREGRLPPPGAAVAARAMQDDPRAEPEYGERVPYIMFQAEPGQKQVHRAIAPGEFLADSYAQLAGFCHWRF